MQGWATPAALRGYQQLVATLGTGEEPGVPGPPSLMQQDLAQVRLLPWPWLKSLQKDRRSILDFVPNVGIGLDSGFSLGEEVNLFHAWDRWEELWQRILDFSNAFSLLSCIQLYYISQPPLQLNVVL